MQKTCFKCGKEKNLEEFYVHPKMKDGHLGKCIACARADAKLRQIEHPEKANARKMTEKRKEAVRKHGREWNERYPERYRAHYTLTNAVRDGRIKKPDACEVCGAKGRVHGHHPDYAFPLEVIWMCVKCHGQIE